MALLTLSKSPHMPGVLPSLRPLGTINRKHLGICRALVQLNFEGVCVHRDKPSEGIPILLSCRTRSDLVPPHLTARLGFVHLTNICAGSSV
ncbi:hypothetical protein [Streptomyces niveus]|uniref:hypothetical protein n=1 Tax=Streptomyces niveus TaxID=193462 RepID=UPI001331A9B7|nr:hypothetical protein [Streptomyces niveus]